MKDLLRRILSLMLVAALAAPVLALPANACVGKTLVIGSTGTVQQDLLAQILSLLISERTGTTVKVVRLDSPAAAHDALLEAELDMTVQYTGAGQLEILEGAPIADARELFATVKARYNQDLNLVWLRPFGFEEPQAVAAPVPAEAAPVVRKDTLKKFPALARLINKLGGTIDAPTMQRLEGEAGAASPREVARAFLKQNRLI